VSAGNGNRKSYDRSYFDRWYRSPRAVVRGASIARKARFAVAAAEHLLGREVRNILDVGCGEGQWRGPLLRARNGAHYIGVDPSEYAIRRFGAKRNLRPGGLADLDALRIGGPFDLIICSDVLQYVPDRELRRGLRSIARRLRGVAYIECFTKRDDMVGDREAWHDRSAEFYRGALRRAGLLACGLYCYIPRDLRHLANELEFA
jgi:SAM-dependent methyltransferase